MQVILLGWHCRTLDRLLDIVLALSNAVMAILREGVLCIAIA
jgi:hypothetical protein